MRMHKYRRTPQDLPNEQFEYIPLFVDLKQILWRANGNSSEFIVETIRGSFEWRSFPIDHDKVKEFLDSAPGVVKSLTAGWPVVSYRSFA